MQMGAHCVWSNDSGTDMEALRLDFPDSFPPESAEDDMHNTTPEVPIPCMAQLLEMEIRACEDAPATTCRCSCSPCSTAIRGLRPEDPSVQRLMVGSLCAPHTADEPSSGSLQTTVRCALAHHVCCGAYRIKVSWWFLA